MSERQRAHADGASASEPGGDGARAQRAGAQPPAAVSGFRHVGDREVYAGKVWDVVVGSFEAPDGTAFEREIVRSPGAVAVAPITYATGDTDQTEPLVTLIVQYRPPFDDFVIEIPAGIRDVAGEADEDNARRELIEEVGLQAGAIEPLGVIYQSPGMTDSAIAIFLATDCTPAERAPHGPEEEHSEVLTVPLGEAVEWIPAGKVRNAATVAGLLLAERKLRHR